MKLSPLRGIFGLPPSTHVSDDMVINSMPIMEIEPGKPHFDSGLNLFSIEPAFTEYEELLHNHGFEIDTNTPIRAACIADNFPTDTFTNDYGETFLQKFTDVASQGIKELTQMTGTHNAFDAMTKMAEFTKNLGGDIKDAGADTFGGIIQSTGAGAEGAATMLRNMKDRASASGQFTKQTIDTLNNMIGGQRVDFPMIWKNSTHTPSYSTTIRLYNPNPGSLEYTNRYITGPLAVFLCLALPQSDTGETYDYPFFHRIKVAGLYRLDPAVITNITVIKGGDQQQVAFTKQLGIVDIRLDFTSLYTALVATKSNDTGALRPTLKKYLNAINERDSEFYTKRNKLVNSQRIYVSLNSTEPIIIAGSSSETDPLRLQQEQLVAKNQAGQKRQAPTGQTVSDEGRVPTSTKETEEALLAQNSGGFIPGAVG